MKLHPRIDYSLLSNDELTLAHTVAHNLFSLRKSEKQFISLCHQKIVSEMERRGHVHTYFDKLDDI